MKVTFMYFLYNLTVVKYEDYHSLQSKNKNRQSSIQNQSNLILYSVYNLIRYIQMHLGDKTICE